MARMYPNRLDPATKSAAERSLYHTFQQDLDNTYTVFHSVAWQALDSQRRRRDGEADFLIAHPERGILVLEVKGGGIDYNARTGQWYSFSRKDNRAHAIKDPFNQARTSKYALQDLLTALKGYPPYRINLGHAVAFPDVTIGNNQFLGSDRPREIVLDQIDAANVSGWVGRALAYWRGELSQRQTAPTKEVVASLMNTLGKSWELRPRMWGEFVQEQEELVQLTEQQYRILDNLNRFPRIAISGCAGSGKTMLAVEKAVRLADQGFHVLLTCFNKNLAADLRSRLKNPGTLEIVHFHELCYVLAEKAGVLPQGDFNDEYFDRLLPEALVTALDRLEVRYDAVIVDEGQDFSDHWWLPLQYLLRDPDHGILYIFYDDNQRIYIPTSTFPIQIPPVGLTVNCRNTQRIHQVVLNFYHSEFPPSVQGPEGRHVEVILYRDVPDLQLKLQRLLDRLIETEAVPSDEIAILAMMNKRIKEFQNERISLEWPPLPGKVYCSTIHSFKGLERAVIVLAGIEQWMVENWDSLDRLLYVGSSRARNHLVVLMSESSKNSLLPLFPGAVVEV